MSKQSDADRSIESASELYQQGYEQGIAWQKAQDLAAVEAVQQFGAPGWMLDRQIVDAIGNEIKRRIESEE